MAQQSTPLLPAQTAGLGPCPEELGPGPPPPGPPGTPGWPLARPAAPARPPMRMSSPLGAPPPPARTPQSPGLSAAPSVSLRMRGEGSEEKGWVGRRRRGGTPDGRRGREDPWLSGRCLHLSVLSFPDTAPSDFWRKEETQKALRSLCGRPSREAEPLSPPGLTHLLCGLCAWLNVPKPQRPCQ